MATVEPHHPAETPVILRECHFRWAESQLELDGSLAPAEQSKAAVEYLEGEEFDVPDSLDLAVRILATGSSAAWSKAELAVLKLIDEQACRDELRHFYERFFNLDPNEREREFHRLSQTCHRFPKLRQLHEHLRNGLNVGKNIDCLDTADLQQFGLCILAMYTAWPTERGQLYRRYLTRFRMDPSIWSTVASQLSQLTPKLYSLGEEWIDEVARGSPPNKAWGRHIFRQVPTMGEQEQSAETPTQQQPVPPSNDWFSRCVRVIAIATIVLIFSLPILEPMLGLKTNGSPGRWLQPPTKRFEPKHEEKSIRIKKVQAAR